MFALPSKRIVALLALGGLLGASPAPSPAPSAVPSVATALTDVTRATLANGLRVVIVRDPLAPVATVYNNYLVGANETPPGFPGMAHAQEHMAFRGCSGVTADQTSAIFAQLGGDGNADTQQSITQYFETVPAADLEIALRVDSGCMRDIADSDKEWSSERGAIEQEVARDLSNPTYNAVTRLGADMFAGTPYEHDPLGTRPSFQKTTGAMLKSFYKTWYAPNNAILVISGDIDPQATLALVKSLYESIPSHPVPAHPDVKLRPVKAESFTLDSDLPYVLSLTAYRMPGSDDPDFAAAQILSDVLGSERADVYALGVQGKALQATFEPISSYRKSGLAAAIGVLPVGADAKAFNATLQSVIANYAKNGVPAELVDAAKRSEIASAEFNRNSVDQLASTWSDALANEGRNSPDDDIDALRKVTVEDVNRVAKAYLDPSKAVTANLVPKGSGKAVASKGFGGGETLTSQPTKPVVLPDWARAQLAQLVVPPSTLMPTDTTLPNGLRLIVQPETTSDTVTVLGQIMHSNPLQTPPGKDGVDAVLAQLFSYGTTSLDRLAFRKALDDIAAQESAGTSFSLHVLKSNFDRGMELLADNELNPALPPSDFAIVKRQTVASVAGEQQSPSYFVERAIAKGLLPQNDPGLREATPRSVGAVTLDDVKNFHARVYRPDMTTIVVIGNVTPDEAKASVAKYFGGWSAQGARPRTELPPVPANKAAAIVVPNRARIQDETSLVQTVPIRRTDADYYALQLGDHVLGGGFYATRLYRDLRQVAGLVYNVSNTLSAGKTRSEYSVSFGSDPQNVSKARQLVARDLRAMQTTDVTPAELQQAKAILLRQLPLGEASEDAVAGGLAGNAAAQLPLDERHRAAEIYARLTAQEVRAAFARDIRPAGFVQVVEGPNPS